MTTSAGVPRLCVILGDQLSHNLSSLAACDPARDIVLMMEVAEETRYVPHHWQKIVLILSAMRHFADELRAAGWQVDYIRLDDTANTGSFTAEIGRAVKRHGATGIVMTEAGEWRVAEAIQRYAEDAGIPLDLLDDTRFIASRAEFAAWAADRKSLTMEYFYREMRRKTGLLIEGDAPVGGKWNFDHDNRARYDGAVAFPPVLEFASSRHVEDVSALVRQTIPDAFGDPGPFNWAVTRADALRALDHFIAHGLAGFGTYQDAMTTASPFLFHSLLSPYLNIGLLEPVEICRRAEQAYLDGLAPLNAVEGFIRQIIGWREFVRGVYWLKMPDYAATNALEARRPLPWFYWSGETAMRCIATTVTTIRRHGYAHHIQRLMVTGNFALLAGLAPAEVEEWYLAVFCDAFDWVELPNTHGMALHADGGIVGTKPYIASGAYIDRMSDYCKECAFDVKQKSGPSACPFNVLYWHFLLRHRERFATNRRMDMPLRTLARMDEARRHEIQRDGDRILNALDAGHDVPSPCGAQPRLL